jgi:hypothetical protein
MCPSSETAKNFRALWDSPQNDVHHRVCLPGPNISDRAATCELFIECPHLLKNPYKVRPRASEVHFRLFLAGVEGVTMENALGLESLSSEFQFVELGRRGGEFVSQHLHVEVVRLTSDLQRRLAGND